jgi:anti-sigma B factor antagonist
MNVVADSDGTLCVTGLDRLSASNCGDFRQLVQFRLAENILVVELDCTNLRFIDSDGLGTLIIIHKRLAPRAGRVRLHQPLPVVRQLLRLLRFDEIFEITP